MRRFSGQNSTGSLAARGIEWLYLIVVFLLMAGVINAVGNAGKAGINLETIVPNTSVQNVAETFIMLFGYIVGVARSFCSLLERQTNN